MKLWVKTIGADGNFHEFVFNTTDYTKINELMIANNISDFKLVDWDLRKISFINF